MKGNCQMCHLSTTSMCLFNSSRHGDSTTAVGTLFQGLTCFPCRNCSSWPTLTFPGTPWGHFLSSCQLRFGRTVWPHSLQPPFQGAVESEKVSSQSPFLQVKQLQFPQKGCALDPLPASLPFSGYVLASPPPSLSERSKTEPSIQSVSSSVLSTRGWSQP